MTKILVSLLALTLAACGSASQAGPKTSNPPLKPDAAAKPEPGPAAKPPVEQEGLTLKFNNLSFKMTMTPSAWKGNIEQVADGSTKIVLLRPDIEAVLVIIPITAAGESAKSITDAQHQGVAQMPDLTLTPVVAETNGRYAFTGDRTVDGIASRTYLAVVPHPTIADAYLVAVAQVKLDVADAFLKEVRTVLDTVAPHP